MLCWLHELPEDVLVHCALHLLKGSANLYAVQHLSCTSKILHQAMQAVRTTTPAQRFALCWSVKRTADDVVLHSSGRGLRSVATDDSWRRAYGLPLRAHGRSTWEVRIDNTRGNQGLMQLGVSLTTQQGVTEWSVSPFYGRLIRRSWDRDGNLRVRAPPPDEHPDGHLKQMLVEPNGEAAQLEGRAIGSIISIILDLDQGYLAFRLDGNEEGPRLDGFPVGEKAARFRLRPVIGMRWPEDEVTIRASSERLRMGWPKQESSLVREQDARGLVAARSLARRLWGPNT